MIDMQLWRPERGDRPTPMTRRSTRDGLGLTQPGSVRRVRVPVARSPHPASGRQRATLVAVLAQVIRDAIEAECSEHNRLGIARGWRLQSRPRTRRLHLMATPSIPRLPRALDDLRGLRAARWIRESTRGQYDNYGPEAQREQQDRTLGRWDLVDTRIEWQVAHSGRTVGSTAQFQEMVVPGRARLRRPARRATCPASPATCGRPSMPSTTSTRPVPRSCSATSASCRPTRTSGRPGPARRSRPRRTAGGWGSGSARDTPPSTGGWRIREASRRSGSGGRASVRGRSRWTPTRSSERLGSSSTTPQGTCRSTSLLAPTR